MSSQTIPATPVTALARAGGHTITFPRVLHSEWIKFWTLRSTRWTLAATVVVMAAVSWLAAFFTAKEVTDPTTKPQDLAELTQLLHDPGLILTGTELAKLVVAVLGVLIITGEYSTGMIRSTLTTVPRRLPALWAKAAVLFVVTAGTVEVAEILSWAVAAPTLHSHDAVLDLGAGETHRILLGGVLYLGGIALLAFAVGAIIRVTAGAMATILGLLLVVEVLFRTLPIDFFQQISPYLPATAGHQLLVTHANIEQARATSTAAVLDPWTGFAVMAAWVTVALTVAAIQLRRRDA